MSGSGITGELVSRLQGEGEAEYGDFSARLIPNIARERVLGVRVPRLRKIAGEFRRDERIAEFLSALPHYFHEENVLHALFINGERTLEGSIALLDAFLPHVDNWAVCDTLRPTAFRKNFRNSLPYIFSLMQGNENYGVYRVRFAIEMLMVHGLGEAFSIEFHERVAALCGEEYYINMMIAWYFATALFEKREETLPYIREELLGPVVFGMTKRKLRDSLRIRDEDKRLFLRD